jgi:alpha-ketoglutarate-dependent 2,4-dichlorophenoxyacetate dioxygenase
VTLRFTQLHPLFVGEASSIDLRTVSDAQTLHAIRAGMDQYGVLVFHDQAFTDAEQLDFAARFDGALLLNSGASAVAKSRFDNEALTDISNVDEDGEILRSDDRRRMYRLGNRLWHTDASFQDPPGRYSMLHARDVPSVPADTEFADMKSAYDALDDDMKTLIAQLRVHHSIAYSRQRLGFEFSDEEAARIPGAIHPLVRVNPRTGRRSLYVASHASRVIDWPLPEGRLLLADLMDHATSTAFRYTHRWRNGDLVIWDNLATMHRGVRYDDTRYRRELRRVTTQDVPRVEPAGELMEAAASI